MKQQILLSWKKKDTLFKTMAENTTQENVLLITDLQDRTGQKSGEKRTGQDRTGS